MSQKVTKTARDVLNETLSEPEPPKPSPAQEIAITALVGGASTSDAALLSGVCRETISRWRTNDYVFIAAYNTARFEHRDAGKAAITGS